MGKKTRSGYDVTFKAFLPFDLTDLFNDGVKSPKEVVNELRAVLVNGGATDVKLKVDHRKRKAMAATPDADADLAGSDMPHAAE